MNLQPTPEPAPSECSTGVTPREAGGYAQEVYTAAVELYRTMGSLQLAYEGELYRTSVLGPSSRTPPDSPEPLRAARRGFWAAVRNVQRLALAPPLYARPLPEDARRLRERGRSALIEALIKTCDWPTLEAAALEAAALFQQARDAAQPPAYPSADERAREDGAAGGAP